MGNSLCSFHCHVLGRETTCYGSSVDLYIQVLRRPSIYAHNQEPNWSPLLVCFLLWLHSLGSWMIHAQLKQTLDSFSYHIGIQYLFPISTIVRPCVMGLVRSRRMRTLRCFPHLTSSPSTSTFSTLPIIVLTFCSTLLFIPTRGILCNCIFREA